MYQEDKITRVENVLDYYFNDRTILRYVFTNGEISPNMDRRISDIFKYGKNVFNVICDKMLEPNDSSSELYGFICDCIDDYDIMEFYTSKTLEKPSNQEKLQVFYGLIGAVALDCDWNFNIIKRVMSALFDLDFRNVEKKEHFFSRVREFAKVFTQGKYCEEFQTIEYEDGTVSCEIILKGMTRNSHTGRGKSIQSARNAACCNFFYSLVDYGFIILNFQEESN